MKKTTKRTIISCVIIIVIAVIAIVGYNVYRRPAAFRHLTDRSLDDHQVNELKDNVPTKDESQSTESENNGKTLVVYFSWSTSGNTEKMATYIQSQTGADILELQPANPYPTDYNETGDVAKAERDENARPEIANLPDSISEYNTIFVGYPIWWHTAPMIIGTFLENYDLTGVDIYPFSQSASMDTEQFDNSMEFVGENAAGANVHDGLFVQADDTDGITSYLKANGFGK